MVAGLTLAVGLVHASAFQGAANSPNIPSKQMRDGRQWTTTNLDVVVDASFCYDDSDANCRRYVRLYTWAAAQRGCRSLGGGWRLPTNEEWQQLAKAYGGIRDDSQDQGHGAYAALLAGGDSGFDVVLGGSRINGEYARMEAHGLYWTASESAPGRAWFYNFGKGSAYVNRHSAGDEQMALSVRCVRE